MRTEKALEYLRSNLDTEEIDVAIILGSGLSFIEEDMEGLKQVETSDIPGYPRSTVTGHKGKISTGLFKGRNILIMAGRVHYYEGYTCGEVVFPVDLLYAAGVKNLILTNAAGGINRSFGTGTMVLLDCYIAPFSEKYKAGLKNPYSEKLNGIFLRAGANRSLSVVSGCYAYMTGPSFETKAEIEYLRLAGGDTVGMSTVPETVRAKELGMEVSCISRVSNPAAGMTDGVLSHIEVLEASKSSQEDFVMLLKEFISLL